MSYLTGSLSVELHGSLRSAGLSFAEGAGVVLSGHGRVDGGCLSITMVHAVDQRRDDAGGGIAEEGDESELLKELWIISQSSLKPDTR